MTFKFCYRFFPVTEASDCECIVGVSSNSMNSMNRLRFHAVEAKNSTYRDYSIALTLYLTRLHRPFPLEIETIGRCNL